MDEYPHLLDIYVDWAVWDALGQLIVARQGAVEKYRLEDFGKKRPMFQRSFEDLKPPDISERWKTVERLIAKNLENKK